MSKTVHLHTPLSEEDVRNLELDDVVYLSGEAYSMLYANHYTLILDLMEQGKEVPMNLKDGVIYNTGTIWRRGEDGNYDMRALGATTSSKFNAQTPPFIAATGIRAIIGKGGMDQATLNAMQEYGCVYLAIVGGCSAVYTPAAKLVDDYWPELMPVDNQRLKFELHDFGPLFVAMDANGNSVYAECADNAAKNCPAIYDQLGIKTEPNEHIGFAESKRYL